ncbi:unnamed protein product [Protopolystoma xenopodis]|uniref:Uncharacterized protein n=1 Tax=Protopolystoma xenopodis TaxID=117903 RepID=A0A448WQC1_9PLAT|nr:unnamed protein product [Protopolystoma xenopodis]
MTNESSAQSHRGRRTVSRRLLRTIQQTPVHVNPPSVAGEANLGIPSTRLLERNARYANIRIEEDCYSEWDRQIKHSNQFRSACEKVEGSIV